MRREVAQLKSLGYDNVESKLKNATTLMDASGLRQAEFPLQMVVCAWCKPKAGGSRLDAWSHGICPRHLRKMRAKVEKMAGSRVED